MSLGQSHIVPMQLSAGTDCIEGLYKGARYFLWTSDRPRPT